MRTLVISDIHHKWRTAQNLIETVPHDKCILLGDYFDQFNDVPPDAAATAAWLRDRVLTNPKIVPLIGNHDQYYLHPKCYTLLRGSGYSDAKYAAIRAILTKGHWDQFKHFHLDQGFAFSHAGLTVHLWKQFLCNEIFDQPNPPPLTLERFGKILSYYVEKAKECTEVFRPAPLFDCGWDRGGMLQQWGGISWCDWRSFAPIKGINQIVGHTPQRLPMVLVQNHHGTIKSYNARDFTKRAESIVQNSTSVNIDLDTHLAHYLVITDGKVEFFLTEYKKSFAELEQYAIPDSPLNNLT